jgi:hypothetical protein
LADVGKSAARWATYQQVARRWGASVRTVKRHLAHEPRVRKRRIGKQVELLLADVHAYEREQGWTLALQWALLGLAVIVCHLLAEHCLLPYLLGGSR